MDLSERYGAPELTPGAQLDLRGVCFGRVVGHTENECPLQPLQAGLERFQDIRHRGWHRLGCAQLQLFAPDLSLYF
jgi:hypothetical protein